MNIVSNDRTGEDSDFSINKEGKEIRTYTHKRLVHSTEDGTNKELANELGYFAGQPFDSDSEALLQKMSISRLPTVEPECRWELTLFFSTEAPPPENSNTDPLQQRVKRTWQTSEQSMYAIRDINGNLIVNSANQPFDGGIPVTVEMPTLVYERNEETIDGALMAAYANSLNGDYYSGASRGQLKLKITAQEQREGQYHYWSVKYEMAMMTAGWQPRPINAGLYQLVDGKLERCKDKDRLDVTSPVPLDLLGAQVPILSLPDGANFVDVEYYPYMDFSALGLDPV